MKIGWIKLHRQILEWEWYSDTNTFRLFLHLLLKANFKDQNHKGKLVKKGFLITGREQLSIETGLSVREVRTCLERLKKTNEIAINSNSKGTEIEILNYDKYQQETNETTSNRPTNDQQSTTIEEYKEIKEKKNNKFDFKKSLLSFGFNSDLVSDWLKVRKKKNLTNSEVAYKDFIKQVELNGNDKNYILEQCVIKSWGGFKSEWLSKQNNFNQINNDVLFVTPEGIEIKDKLALHVYKQTGKV